MQDKDKTIALHARKIEDQTRLISALEQEVELLKNELEMLQKTGYLTNNLHKSDNLLIIKSFN